MGTLEKKSKRKRRNKKIQKVVLETVAAAGVISVALVAPNVIGAMRKLGIPLSIRQDATVVRARKRLVEKKLLAHEHGLLRLTKKGRTALNRVDLAEYGAQKKKQRWDKRWRIVIFDIPEKKRVLRDKIRYTLIQVGFMRLQDSVWVYPYDCEDLIILLKAELRIGKELLYIIAEEIEHDVTCRSHFGLKS